MTNNNLTKIKDVSDKYGITARTLRYYEDMGLINSVRSDDYAYRSYSEEAIKKLEQILILRRLNISVKDIRRIFKTAGSEVILEILGKKVDDIDEEVALLHELKEIVLKFIKQINQSDLSKDSDIKLLYEQAKEIEKQIVNADNAVDLDRLIEVSDKLKKPEVEVSIQNIRVFKFWESDTVETIADKIIRAWNDNVITLIDLADMTKKRAEQCLEFLNKEILERGGTMNQISAYDYIFTPKDIKINLQLGIKGRT